MTGKNLRINRTRNIHTNFKKAGTTGGEMVDDNYDDDEEMMMMMMDG